MAIRCASTLPIKSAVFTTCRAPRRYLFTTSRRDNKAHTSNPDAQPPISKPPTSAADDYYTLLLDQPLPSPAISSRIRRPISSNPESNPPVSPISPPPSKYKNTSSTTTTSTGSASNNSSNKTITFSSTLSGPGARQRYVNDLPTLEAAGKGEYIAGTWIPPKPVEPDNCCMSGCVDCVWDGYREELEEWVGRRRGAMGRVASGGGGGGSGKVDGAGGGGGDERRVVGDEGRVGSSAGSGGGDWELESVMGDIPVGIREFMKIEKKLKMQREQHQQQHA